MKKNFVHNSEDRWPLTNVVLSYKWNKNGDKNGYKNGNKNEIGYRKKFERYLILAEYINHIKSTLIISRSLVRFGYESEPFGSAAPNSSK